MMMMMKNQRRTPGKPTSINDLPEAILIRIISFLPLIDSAATSAVARPWRNLWLSVPALRFDMKDFLDRFPGRSEEKKRELFNDVITNTLQRRPGDLTLHKLIVAAKENQQTTRYVDSWLQPLIASKVVELDLKFYSKKYFSGRIHVWDTDLFFDLIKGSVEVMKLDGIGIRDVFLNVSKLESIRQVHLNLFRATDKDIENLIASCIHIETLSLSRGYGLMNLKIVSKNLKHLKLFWFNNENRGDLSVEICAPSLISFDYEYINAHKLTINKPESLVEAKVVQEVPCSSSPVVWNCISGVERLTLEILSQRCFGSTPTRPEEVWSGACNFRNLIHVELMIGFMRAVFYGLETLLKLSPQLETMVLNNRAYGSGHPHVVSIDILVVFVLHDSPEHVFFRMPRLRVVEILSYSESQMELCVVELLKKHGVVLEKIIAFPVMVDGKSLPPIIL